MAMPFDFQIQCPAERGSDDYQKRQYAQRHVGMNFIIPNPGNGIYLLATLPNASVVDQKVDGFPFKRLHLLDSSFRFSSKDSGASQSEIRNRA